MNESCFYWFSHHGHPMAHNWFKRDMFLTFYNHTQKKSDVLQSPGMQKGLKKKDSMEVIREGHDVQLNIKFL